MKPQIALILILATSSCSSIKQEATCESTFGFKQHFEGQGITPIELIKQENAFRIWIDRSSSTNQILTIIKDNSGSYAEFVEVGYHFKRGKKKPHFSKVETCPINGWANFFKQFDRIDPESLVSRKNFPDNDGIILHHPMSKYLVEIKGEYGIKKFEFYSFYPSQRFPQDMEKYKGLEKLILTSFPSLAEELKFSQDYHERLGPFEY